jgi:hypothetical protein
MRGRPVIATLIASVIVGAPIASAQAGPCSGAIAQFEQAVRSSARTVHAEPTAPQSIGAQLHHQPTPESVGHAEGMAQAALEQALSRAKTLDAEGNEAECMQALSHAKLMFDSR